MNKIKKSTKKGITLIETVLYMGLFSIIMIAVVPTLYSIENVSDKISATQLSEEDSIFIQQKIKSLILNASQIIVPEGNSSANVLRISSRPYNVISILQIENNTFEIVGTNETNILHNPHLKVDNFLVRRITLPDNQEKIEFNFSTNGKMMGTSTVYLFNEP